MPLRDDQILVVANTNSGLGGWDQDEFEQEINQIIPPDSAKVRVSDVDTIAKFLSEKLTAGANITLTVLNPGGDEQLEIASTASGGGLEFVSQDPAATLDLSDQDVLTTLSVGPTDSGADIEWPVLDDLEYSALYLTAQISGIANGTDNSAVFRFFAGPMPLTNSESTHLLNSTISQTTANSGKTLMQSNRQIIEVDENGIFDFRWNYAQMTAESPGHQKIDMGGTVAGAGATGLANDATEYTADIAIDGVPNPVVVVGSTAQTFDDLVTVVNAQLTGGEMDITGDDNLQVTSALQGLASSVEITDTDLFMSLTGFVEFFPAVEGTDAPTVLLNLIAYQPA